MKKIIGLSFTLLTGVMLISSCQKKCTGTDTYSGNAIVHEVNGNPVIIYPEAGYLTSNMSGNYVIDEDSYWADQYEVSFDNGKTRTPINYDQYVLMANPKFIPCNGAVARTLEIDYTFQTVTYTATPVSDCDAQCKGEGYTVENYILVDKSKLPAAYMIYFK